MMDFGAARSRNGVIFIARVALMALFVIFGWQKLTAFGATTDYFSHTGLPLPTLAAAFAIAVELLCGLALIAGFVTRPVAIFLALYTLATAFIGHPYWTMTGVDQYEAMTNFYKNVSIIGGLLLLYATGGGKYSLDARLWPMKL
jgi:putative oxidoreductase